MENLEIPARRQIHVVGGGTIEPVREHLALAARAYGGTARRIGELCGTYWSGMDVNVHLTKMADPSSDIETGADLRDLAEDIITDFRTKVVFWSPAVADFRGEVAGADSGLHADRLKSDSPKQMDLIPNDKIVPMFRKDSVAGMKPRKDIFAVGFKTTTNAAPEEQYSAGLKLLKGSSLNLVLANDTVTRNNMVVTPEEAPYHETTDREMALRGLLEMAYLRSQLTFTESTVVAGEPVDWNSSEVYDSLRTVVNYCIEHDAYKPFMGVTAGHFAAKVGPTEFLTSRRKTNFNNLISTGLVKVVTDGPDKVVAFGAKPSVGGQSQRIVFEQHPEKDCIVHFHCPTKPDSKVPVVSQREFECGSHECGENTSQGLRTADDGEIEVVYLDKHGPNIVFNHSIDPQKVIAFIEKNFDLSAKTGGYVPVS
ncbi:MAG TPA: class II aldolase/adducin family protein [Candidatus Saccharimonadales bacterium]|nr:class II aldolase/adducin family protein [Candidatus Saccharimonadales bacterium]